MTHASLFSGIGGFDLAAEWAGLENLFYCEINKFCQQVLQYHFPKSKSYENIKTTDFREWRGKVDVISGGFPCQPFSVAGQRKGADDDRYLWPEMLRAIREIQPTWVIGENVAGILTMVQPGEEVKVGSQQTIFGEADRERTMLRQQFVVETVCIDLEREGYSVQPFVIPACAVGAPHRRDRVWFVANRNSYRCRRWEDEQKSIKRIKRTSNDCTCCKDGIASDTDGNRSTSRKESEGIEESRRRNFSQQEEWRNTSERDSRFFGFSRDAANSERKGFQKRIQSGRREDETKVRAWMDVGVERHGCRRVVTYSQSCELQRKRFPKKDSERRRENKDGRFKEHTSNSRFSLSAERWKDFPTVSPVCGRDDGLPFDVDSLTIPFTKWRQESVKAYGNAIVPQVAYEIFIAIVNQ